MINIGDLYAREQRKLLITFDVPAVANLGTATIADITIDFTTVADLADHHVELPVSVNVVPGDQARSRVPNPVVQVEQLLADSDDAKKAATQALRDRDTDRAKTQLTDTLGAIR
ncbi:MAG: hypothetical protein WAO41_09745, partial [Candidatus Nanopelagicales bacterium]